MKWPKWTFRANHAYILTIWTFRSISDSTCAVSPKWPLWTWRARRPQDCHAAPLPGHLSVWSWAWSCDVSAAFHDCLVRRVHMHPTGCDWGWWAAGEKTAPPSVGCRAYSTGHWNLKHNQMYISGAGSKLLIKMRPNWRVERVWWRMGKQFALFLPYIDGRRCFSTYLYECMDSTWIKCQYCTLRNLFLGNFSFIRSQPL